MKLNKEYNLGIDPYYGANHKLVCPDIFYGVELELEQAPYINGHGVIVKEDGSLRNNGREYCTPPLQGGALLSSLLWLCEKVQGAEVNHRCGTHIHVNIGNMSKGHLLTVIKVFSLLEGIIFNSFARGREDNNSCLPLYKLSLSNSFLNDIFKDVKERDKEFLAGTDKYMSLNINPMVTYGTIEFRLFRATKDFNTLLDYLNIVGAVVKTGYRLKNKSNGAIKKRALGLFTNYCNKFLSSERKVVYTTEHLNLGIDTFDFITMENK